MAKVITLSGLRWMGMVGAEQPVVAEKPYPKLLNFGIAAGAGALVGLVVAVSKSKKFSSRAAGAGVGAALASLILVMTWPKQRGA